MNLIGKIFTVLIVVMSVVFMAFVVAVYATHKNWRDVVMDPQDGLAVQLETQKKKNQDLKDQLDKLNESLTAEKADRRQALAKAETESDELKRERDQQEQELGRLKQDLRDAVAAMDATQTTLAGLRTEVDTLRKDVDTARKDRQDQFAKVVKITDDLHQAVNELKALKDRNTTLAADYASALEVLRKFDLEPTPAAYKGVPPTVRGVVTAVRAGGLVELSIGSDDGLMPGHTLEVYRLGPDANMYLGKVEVTDVSPDKSVAKVVPEFLKGAIQAGDHVSSKLK